MPKIRNQGFELTVDATPLLYRNFSWKSLINMSANKNKVVTLHPDYPNFPTTKKVSTQAIRCASKKEAAWGYLWKCFRRNEDGSIMVDETSKRPLGNTETRICLGMPIQTSPWDGATHLPTRTWSSIS